MPINARWTFRRFFQPHILTAVVVVLIASVLYLSPLEPSVRVPTEAFLYLVLFSICASHAPLRAAVLQVGVPRLFIIGTLLFLAICGQLYKWSSGSYPFPTWSMYANLNPATEFSRYHAIRRSGSTIMFPLPRGRMFEANFFARLNVLRRSQGESSEKTKATADLNAWLSSLAQAYNRRHTGDPIQTVQVVTCAIRIHEYTGPDSFPCTPVFSVEIPE